MPRAASTAIPIVVVTISRCVSIGHRIVPNVLVRVPPDPCACCDPSNLPSEMALAGGDNVACLQRIGDRAQAEISLADEVAAMATDAEAKWEVLVGGKQVDSGAVPILGER